MSIATDILTTPDRTPKERRDWAEFVSNSFKSILPTVKSPVYLTAYYFSDGSALLMEFDADLSPVEIVEL